MTTYNIHAFTQELSAAVLPALHGADIEALTAQSTATVSVSKSALDGLIKFKTDATDIDDTNQAEDLVFSVNKDVWKASVDKYASGTFAVTGNACLPNETCQLVSYDRIRWEACDLFGAGTVQAGAFGVDLFSNESDLRNEIADMDSNIEDHINSKLDAANGMMMNNDTNDNIGRVIVLKTLESNAQRFKTDDLLANASRDDSGYYPFKFNEGDSIVMKVTYQPAPGTVNNDLGALANKSYLYKINVTA